MPPKSDPLAKKEIQILRDWIDAGAKSPLDEAPQLPIGQRHWAFQPVKRPEEPAVKDDHWLRNGIDRFILARLEEEELAPSPEADRVTLIRRLNLDLLGLPPTPAEVDAFLNDKRADAYEQAGGAAAGSAALRRALGPALARRGPLRRLRRLQHRHRRAPSGSIATGSSTRSTATCRSTSSPSSNSPATCCPMPRSSRRWRPDSTATRDQQGRRHRLEQFRVEGGSRSRQHDRHGLPRLDHGLLPVSRPQVRPVLAEASITRCSPSSITATSPRSTSPHPNNNSFARNSRWKSAAWKRSSNFWIKTPSAGCPSGRGA